MNSKRLYSSAVYLFIWYVLKHCKMRGHIQKPKTTGNSYKKPENEVLWYLKLMRSVQMYRQMQLEHQQVRTWNKCHHYCHIHSVRRILFTSYVDVVCLLYIIEHISMSYELITVSVVGDNKRFVCTRKWYFYNNRERKLRMSNELQNNILVSVLFLYGLIGRECCTLHGSPCILVLEQNMT